mgnify:CR=1 FL=1
MPAEYRSALEIVSLIAATSLLAMGFMAWRIYRAQHPKELRWPKKSRRRRRSSRS